MSQLGRFDESYADPATGRPRRNASVTLYREGATVSGNQSGTSPLAITVRHRGKIAASDTVFIGTDTATTYSVNSVTATTITISGFVGTLNVSNGDRITPSNSQPTLYSDDQGGATTANPLTTSALGRANCWMELGAYDVVVSGSTMTTTAFVSQVVPSETPAQVRRAEAFPGVNAGERIANAIADLPSTGGTIDARGLTGAQTIATTCAFGTVPVRVLLGAASYTLDAGFTSSATANVAIVGLGGTLTTLTRGAAYTGVLFTFSGVLSGLEIDGLNVDNNNTALNCIELANGSSDIRIHHNRFPNQGSGSVVKTGTGASLNKRVDISHNYIESATSTQNIRAIDGSDPGDFFRANGNTIIKTGAISLNQGSAGVTNQNQIEVCDNFFQGVDSSNILVRPVSAGTLAVTDVIVSRNIFEDAGLTLGKGFIVIGENAGGAGPPVFRRCVVSGNIGRGFGDSSGSGVGIGISGDANPNDGSEIIVSDNILDARQKDGTQQNSSYGIYVRGDSRNVTVHDNVVRNTGRSGITLQDVDFVTVHDNVIELAVQYAAAGSPPVSEMGGIQVQTGVTQATIHHNKILNPGTAGGNSYGIYVRNNSTNDVIVIDSNEVVDDRGGGAAMTQAIFLGATATNVYALNNRTTGGLVVDFTQDITAVGNTIRPSSDPVRLTANASYTLTSTPTVTSGFNGQRITIINVDTADSVTLQDQGTLANSNLRLSAATIALAPRDSIVLQYDTTIGDWAQVCQTNVI